MAGMNEEGPTWMDFYRAAGRDPEKVRMTLPFRGGIAVSDGKSVYYIDGRSVRELGLWSDKPITGLHVKGDDHVTLYVSHIDEDSPDA